MFWPSVIINTRQLAKECVMFGIVVRVSPPGTRHKWKWVDNPATGSRFESSDFAIALQQLHSWFGHSPALYRVEEIIGSDQG
jgi:hypothetical protein